jgi:hypothetical protein
MLKPTPRRKPDMACIGLSEVLWTGKPMHIVASSREQAERTLVAATSLFNGRDPKGLVPG